MEHIWNSTETIYGTHLEHIFHEDVPRTVPLNWEDRVTAAMQVGQLPAYVVSTSVVYGGFHKWGLYPKMDGLCGKTVYKYG